MKKLFFKTFDHILIFFSKFHLPWVKKILDGDKIRQVENTVKNGDVVLVKSIGWLTSAFFPKEYTHVSMVKEGKIISDSTPDGVRKRDILNCLVGYSKVAVVRPLFSDEEFKKLDIVHEKTLNEEASNPIFYNWFLVEIGTDDNYKELPKSLTCSQWVNYLLNQVRPDFMKPYPRYGFMTTSPQDFYNARDKFELVLEL